VLTQLWTDIKKWFNYSWSILIARLEVLTGILTGVLGGLDWTALTQLDWSQGIKSTSAIIVSALLIVKGIVSEIGRRAGTVTTATDQIVAVNIAEKAKLPLKK
jgi:hypothetical protein